MIDLEYSVTETSSATANFQVGYSDAYGLLYGANLNQTNFLGTGRRVSADFQANDAATNISLSYYNPYYTMSGIGRGFTVYTSYADPGKVGYYPISNGYLWCSINYDIPITEYSRLSFALGYDNIRLYTNQGASNEIKTFIRQYGDKFDVIKGTLGWSRSTYDSAIFPTMWLETIFRSRSWDSLYPQQSSIIIKFHILLLIIIPLLANLFFMPEVR